MPPPHFFNENPVAFLIAASGLTAQTLVEIDGTADGLVVDLYCNRRPFRSWADTIQHIGKVVVVPSAAGALESFDLDEVSVSGSLSEEVRGALLRP